MIKKLLKFLSVGLATTCCICFSGTIVMIQAHFLPPPKTFDKTLFIGDSQTIAIADYKFLPSKNVAAKKGLAIPNALNYPDITNKLKHLQPEKVVTLFGHNDIVKSTDSKIFIKNYKALIKLIRTLSPKSTIYVESVTPVSKNAEAKYPHAGNPKISEFNQCLKAMAKENNLHFIDISKFITDSNYAYLEPDGIHLKASFYPLLLNFLAKTIESNSKSSGTLCMAK